VFRFVNRIIILIIIFAVSAQSAAYAAKGTGQADATLLANPLNLSLEEALALCKKEPQLKSCHLIRMKKEHTYIEGGQERKKAIYYDVINKNFE
jgi:hypothetical protein